MRSTNVPKLGHIVARGPWLKRPNRKVSTA